MIFTIKSALITCFRSYIYIHETMYGRWHAIIRVSFTCDSPVVSSTFQVKGIVSEAKTPLTWLHYCLGSFTMAWKGQNESKCISSFTSVLTLRGHCITELARGSASSRDVITDTTRILHCYVIYALGKLVSRTLLGVPSTHQSPGTPS